MNRYEILLGIQPSEEILKQDALNALKAERRAENNERPAREALISELIGSEAGRNQLAQAMVAPLRQRRDYAGVARRAFRVESLPEGALPVYGQDSTS